MTTKNTMRHGADVIPRAGVEGFLRSILFDSNLLKYLVYINTGQELNVEISSEMAINNPDEKVNIEILKYQMF